MRGATASKGVPPQSVFQFQQYILNPTKDKNVLYNNDLDLCYVHIHERQPLLLWRRSLSEVVCIGLGQTKQSLSLQPAAIVAELIQN